ncbi:hypothetical protein RhiirC2_789784 [Rhizophagus irregularis]|uniref:Uncharacterized protein n=1 Tax=Rhizophagus irregularis TaxID=588596 RepID=A0A2N1MMG4_9GLOM|nr:hypothetical protein RhiirC2_789784 [Rhizophagus irregularis]
MSKKKDEHSIPQNTSIILRKPKSIQSSGETILEVSSQVLPKETKVSPDYIIVQDFVQDVSSELIDEDDIQIIDGNQELTTDMTISRSVQEIIAKDNVSERQENVRPKVPFEKSHESVPKKLPYVVSELPAEASTPTQKEHAGHHI